ncbi:MAG TPA: ABC transporter permease [Bryobacteraceae bacterium]|nr:ABC transporter permease [Bryobacteraceae bacterium]
MLLQDIRYALRVLLKNRAFTLVAVLSLAVGIGANSAMFSFADGLMLRPLPVLHPNEVVTIHARTSKGPQVNLSYRDYVDYRDRNTTFDGLVAYSVVPFGFAPRTDALPQVKYGLMVSGNFFQAMGVVPAIGRGFRPDEDEVPGRDAVVVLGHDFWMQQFGGDPSAVGKTLQLNGLEFHIIGVAPEEFSGMDQYLRLALFVPIHISPRLASDPKNSVLESRDNRSLLVKGRLKPGVSIARAEAELQVIAKSLEQTYPETNRDQGISIRTELQARVEQSPPDATLVGMLLTLSALVLLVACANVANLLLSRARARSREIAVRLAIGAGRFRLVRQLLTESLVIGIGGGMLGLAVAYGAISFLNQVQVPSELPISLTFHLNARTLVFGITASLFSVILFGLIPAFHTTRTDLVRTLKAGDADSLGKQRLWGRNLLVVGQVAVSLVLLVLTSMLYRGFTRELKAGPGFRTDHLLLMSFDPSLVKFSEAQTQQFFKQLVDRAAAMPGVKSAALASVLPMFPVQDGRAIAPENYQFPKGKDAESMLSATVDNHYFETMDVKIVHGRAFGPADTASTPKVAVINEVVASKYWPNQDPVGKRFHLDDSRGPLVQVIGVAKTAKYLFISEPPLEYFYLPLSQNPKTHMSLVAQSVGDAQGLAAPLREAVRGIDANQPIYDVRTMEDFYQARAVKTPDMIVETVGAMGVLGLLLAMVGLYGLVAYSVSRRTREFGIRMAIGAERTQVLRMVMRQGLWLSLAGILIGLVLSQGARQVLNSAFGPGDAGPVTFVLVPAALLAVTLLAAFVPALRASRVPPMKALRYE